LETLLYYLRVERSLFRSKNIDNGGWNAGTGLGL
jgi:hypothetical protein